MPIIVQPSHDQIAAAAQRLSDGGIVAFATETVYGLGALTLSPAGIDRIYRTKGRPANNPLIAHVLDAESARSISLGWNEKASILTDPSHGFWPGPLTIILNRAAHVPPGASGGRPTIAMRSPAHPVARQLLETVACPISAPSANRSGHVSPTTASHVAEEFAEIDDLLILDGGACVVGIESTVVDLTTPTPRLLRPGSVSAHRIKEHIGPIEIPRVESQSGSPGTSLRHYAPRTTVEIVSNNDLRDRIATHAAAGRRVTVLGKETSASAAGVRVIKMPQTPEEYARQLYARLREADASGADRLLIEDVPSTDDWAAIRDRLRRASAT